MQWKLKTAPARKFLTVGQVKKHLCLTSDFTESDVSIEDYLNAAIAYVDGANGVLGRAIITQTWTAVLDAFPNVFEIHLPPVQSVLEIRYTDTTLDTQILSSALYNVSYLGFEHQPALVERVSGGTWPIVGNVLGGVEIDVVVGYGTTPASVPHNIKQLTRALISSMFEEKNTTIDGSVSDNPVYSNMIAQARYMGFSS